MAADFAASQPPPMGWTCPRRHLARRGRARLAATPVAPHSVKGERACHFRDHAPGAGVAGLLGPASSPVARHNAIRPDGSAADGDSGASASRARTNSELQESAQFSNTEA